ncbi:hypothetical protein MY3296_008041 [Beauveria thailandica]
MQARPNPEMQTLTRLELHHLIAARSGHGDFANYHERFDHPDARVICNCGRRKTPARILFCPLKIKRGYNKEL